MKKKLGFTLAEVLITLGIIGVVAALTTPALIQNTGSAQIGPKLAKAVSTFNTASQNLLVENGVNRVTSVASTSDAYGSALTSYMKMYSVPASRTYTVTEYDGSEYKDIAPLKFPDSLADNLRMKFSKLDKSVQSRFVIPNPRVVSMINQSNNYAFKNLFITPAFADGIDMSDYVNKANFVVNKDLLNALNLDKYTREVMDPTASSTALINGAKFISNDGVLYTIGINQVPESNNPSHGQRLGYVHIDINGLSEPNAIGKDVFVFTLWNDGSIRPLGSIGSLGGGEGDDQLWPSHCDATTITDGGVFCAGSIFENNLKVIYQ